jgi:hypothetical protein
MDANILTINIKDAFEKRTDCPLCYLIEKRQNRFLETFYSEWIMDAWSRESIIRSRGFCSYHFHQILRFAEIRYEKLGLALVLEDLVKERLKSLELLLKSNRRLIDALKLRKRSSFPRILRKNPEPTLRFAEEIFNNLRSIEELCPACKHLSEFDRIHIDTFIQMLIQDQAFRDAFKESGGLCIPHTVKTVGIASRKVHEQGFASIAEILLPLQIKVFKHIRFELSEFIRKHDYRFAREGFGSEKDAVERAAVKLAGTSQLGTINVEGGRPEDRADKNLDRD